MTERRSSHLLDNEEDRPEQDIDDIEDWQAPAAANLWNSSLTEFRQGVFKQVVSEFTSLIAERERAGAQPAPELLVQAPIAGPEAPVAQDAQAERPEALERLRLDRTLSADEQDRLIYLQTTLSEQLRHRGRSLRIAEAEVTRPADEARLTVQEVLLNRLNEEANGIVRNARGEITQRLGRPYAGPATALALGRWAPFMETELIPGLYARIAASRGEMPTRGPIPLQLDREGGRTVDTALFIQNLENGTVRCNLGLGLERGAIPSWNDLQRVSDSLEWADRAEQVISRANLERQQEIVRRRMQRMNMPSEWRVNSAEECAAAMSVMRLARETGRIIECLNHLSTSVTPERRAEYLESIATSNLPPGVVIEREGGTATGRITNVRFDFPPHLNLQAPEFRTQLRGMLAFCEQNGRLADQMMADYAAEPQNTIGWLDVEAPHGWVRTGRNADGSVRPEFSQSQHRPAGAGWAHCNLLQFRADVSEQRDTITGNVNGVRVTNTLDYCDVPLWSYLNLYRPNAEGSQQFRMDAGVRNPDDWACVRTSPNECRFMRYRDLADHVDDQRFQHYAGMAIVAAMDISMLVGGVGEIAAGARAIRTAGSAYRTVQAARAASTFGSVTGGAELVQSLTSNSVRVARAQMELRAAGQSTVLRGMREVLIAGTAIPTTNSRTAELPAVRTLGEARGLYMLGSIGYGTLIQAPHDALRYVRGIQREVSLAERLTQGTLQSGPSWIRGCERAGQWGFAATQIPFAVEQIVLLNRIASSNNPFIDNIGDANLSRLRARQERGAIPTEPTGAQTQAEIFASLERYREAARGTDPNRQRQIDALINGSRDLMAAAPWLANDFVGPPDPTEVNAWEQRRSRFVNEQIAPFFLPSADTIRTHEIGRARQAPLNELERQPALTDTQINDLYRQGRLGEIDPAMRAAAAAALLYLTRSTNGSLAGINRDGNTATGAGVLFQRAQQIEPWNVTRTRARHGDRNAEEVRIAVPRQADQNRTVTQSITMAAVANALEQQLPPGSPAALRIASGEILTRAGMPAQTYGAVLRDIIASAQSSPEIRNQAIANLGSVIQALRGTEQEQRNLDAGAQFELGGMSNGLTSRHLRRFLEDYARNPANDINNRALAAYISHFASRHNIEASELTRLQAVLDRRPPALSFDEFVRETREAALSTTATTPAQWERRLASARLLTSFLDLPEARIGFNINQINRAIAECTGCQRSFSEALSTQRQQVVAAQTALQQARAGNRPQAEIARLQQAAQEQQADLARRQRAYVAASDVALAATNELLQQTRHNGVLRRRIDHMDASDDPLVRQSAVAVRRNALSSLTAPVHGEEVGRQRTQTIQLLEPLLNSSRLARDNATGRQTATELDTIRQQAAAILRMTLLPGLTDEARRAALTEQFPGQIDPTVLETYRNLYAAAQRADFGASLREAAINSLSSMVNRAAAPVIRRSALPENESDPDIRVAAVRAMQRLLPAAEMNEFSQEMRSRRHDNPAHPPERDPGVVIQLTQRSAPTAGREHPDGAMFRQARDAARAMLAGAGGPDFDQIQRLVNTPAYRWLLGNNVTDEVTGAVRQVYNGSNLAAFWQDWNLRPGDTSRRAPGRELEAQNRALTQFRQRFNELCLTAVEGRPGNPQDSATAAREARQVLFYLLTSNGDDWRPTNGAPRHAGVFNLPIGVNMQTFRGMQNMAAEALLNTVSRRNADGSVIRLPDTQAREVEALIARAIAAEATPSSARIALLSALSALAQNQSVGGAAERAAAIPLTARACQIVEQAMLRSLAARPAGAPALSENEQALRNQFAMRSLQFLQTNEMDPRIFASIQGIADSEQVLSVIRHRARAVIAECRDQVIPHSAIRVDQVDGRSPEARLALLRSAQECAQPPRVSGTDQSGREAGADLSEIRARRAVELIFQGSRQMPITQEADSRATILQDLMNARYHERVRLAAAIALLTESSVGSHREEAVRLLVQISVRSERPGCRQDAQLMLERFGTTANLRQVIYQSFDQARESLVQAMRTDRRDNARLTEDEVVNAMQRANPQHPLLMQYAACSSNQGSLAARANEDALAARLLARAFNIYRNQPIATDLPDRDMAYRTISQPLVTQFRGHERMRDVAATLDRLSDFHGRNLSDSQEAQRFYAIANHIRNYSLGFQHPESVQSMFRGAQLLHGRTAEIGQSVTRNRQSHQEMEALIAGQANPSGLQRALATDARDNYLTSLNEYIRGLRDTSGAFLRLGAQVRSTFGTNSSESAQYCDNRGATLSSLALALRLRAALEPAGAARQSMQAEATRLAQSAETLLRGVVNIRQAMRSSPETFTAQVRLGSFYIEHERFEDARRTFESARANLSPNERTERAVHLHGCLAITYQALNNRQLGDASLEQWLTTARALYGQHSTQLGAILQRQARIYAQQQRWDLASGAVRTSVDCESDPDRQNLLRRQAEQLQARGRAPVAAQQPAGPQAVQPR